MASSGTRYQLSGTIAITRRTDRPVTAVHIPAQNEIAQIAASTIPIGWMYPLAIQFPRTNHEKLVVIPQAGQGYPVVVKNAHPARCSP
jgi:hypothetical protein